MRILAATIAAGHARIKRGALTGRAGRASVRARMRSPLIRFARILRASALLAACWVAASAGRARAGEAGPPGVSEREFSFWLARAFDWSADSASAPAALERRGVIEAAAGRREASPELPANRALDWCERAARSAGFAMPPAPSRSFRASLLTGIAHGDDARTITPAQALGMIANLRYPRLRILETTDFHGFILPRRGAKGRRAMGGTVALAAWIDRLRGENPEGTILLDGGDWFQGTMISNLAFGRPVVEQMNRMGYAATAIGNHDFDWGIDTLERRISEMRFTALGANCLDRATGERAAFARSDTLLVRRGVRVGILGLCLASTATATAPRNVASLRFADDSTTAARLVPGLRARGAQVVLGLGHTPAESAPGGRAQSGDLVRLARGIPGVDAWFGGHSHNRVRDEAGGVPLLIAGAHGEVIGVCDLTVDPVAGRVIDHRLALIPVWTDSLPADSALAGRVREWNSLIAPLAAVEIGRSARALPREGDPSVGELVTDAMRAAAESDIALANGGGLRAGLPSGVITRGAIYELMPFDDRIVTAEIPGERLRELFEDVLRRGHLPRVSGVRLTCDASRPAMHRVASLTLADGTPPAPDRLYRVAINDFMAAGGDGFALPQGAGAVTETGVLVRDAIETFVAERSKNGAELRYQRETRVKRVTRRR